MNWPHVHLALNHVPVLGTSFLGLLLMTAIARRSEEMKRVSLWGLFLLAAISIPIKFTGDFASESQQLRPELNTALVSHHEQTADQATTGVFLVGLLALAGLIAARRGKPVPTWAVTSVLIATLATFGLMLRTANSGGQIRHPEIRPSLSKGSARDLKVFGERASCMNPWWNGGRRIVTSRA